MQTEKQNLETQSSVKPLSNPIEFYQDLIWDICEKEFPEQIEIAELFHDRVKNEYDNHVSIEGGTGSGKSMATLIQMHLGYRLKKKMFDIKKHCVFVPDEGELKTALDDIQIGLPFWVDEAIKALDKHFWYKIEQIQLNHRAKTDRYKLNTIFYNMQRFSEFNESFRNSNIYFRLIVIPRTAMVLRIKDEDPDIEDPWHIRESVSAKNKDDNGNLKINVVRTPFERLNKERLVPNYYMDADLLDMNKYPDLKEYWEYYKALRDEAKLEASKRRVQQSEQAETVIKILQKESLKGCMKYELKKDPNLKCLTWYFPRKKYMPLSQGSIYNYWREVETEIRNAEAMGVSI